MMKYISNVKLWYLISYVLVLIAFISVASYYRFILKGGDDSIVHLRQNYIYGGGVWDKNYMNGTQRLSKQRLNLNVWGGFHEVKLLNRIEQSKFKVLFDLYLSNDSYVYIYFDRSNEEKSQGVRLSKNKMFPSLFFIRDGDGKFLVKKELKVDISKNLNQIEMIYDKPSIVVKMNGLIIFAKSDLNDVFNTGVSLAWGGSDEHTPVYIDNIKIQDISGKIIYENSFGIFDNVSLYQQALLPVLLLLIYYCIVKYISSSLKYEIFINVNIIVAMGSMYLLYYFLFSSRYFVHEGMTSQDIVEYYKEIEKKYLKNLQDEQKKKVFFYGGSKTFGDGARTKERTWVNLLTSDLDKKMDSFNPFIYINWGCPSADTGHILGLHKQLLRYKPAVTILLIGVNDHDSALFYKNVQEMIKLNRENNIYTVIVEELTYINNIKDIESNDAVQNFVKIRELCQQKNVTCISQSDRIYDKHKKLYDSGIRWVEWVHYNSYGQKLFAKIIEPEIFNMLKNFR